MSTRILIVEDEGIIARDIQRQLLDLGYEPVDIAMDGAEAIRRARELRPDLVLMDIHLAGAIDGIEAATTIRWTLEIPCVFLTAYATNDVVERAKKADPSGYIIKPFDEQILRTTVEIAINKDRLNRELRRSEALLAEAQGMANMGSGEIDLVRQTAHWSPEVYRIFEVEPDDQAPTLDAFRNRIHPDDRAIVQNAREWRGTGMLGIEVRLQMPDGRTKFVRMRGRTDTDPSGKPLRQMMTVQDITQHRAAEHLLRLQSAALNSTTTGVIITDYNGTIEWVNPAFTAATGYTLDDAVGRNPRDLLKSGVHDRAFYESLWNTITAGQVWRGELTNRRKDGTLHVEEQTITPVWDEHRHLTHFVGVKRDLTEQKRLEQQFLQAQKMEVVGRLAGGIAHDFNNLLTIINGTCDLALMDLPPGHPTGDSFEEIRTAGERAARLTQQLLAFSRRQVLNPAVVNVGRTVTDSAKMLRRLIGEDIQLQLDLDSSGADQVFVDQSQLEQVLLNLAVNARDAMPRGGTLSIQTRVRSQPAAAVRAGEPDTSGSVQITVTDTGVGMSADVRERIFEPFFTTKAEGKGTGLGLATVYGIVHQSGGTIDVDSEPGKGSCFAVTLPRVERRPAEVAAGRPAVAAGAETILVVEDEAALRGTTVRMLESAGYTVRSARTGDEALGIIADCDDIALVVSDVVMPGLSGLDVAESLRQTDPHLPVLLVSGYTDDKLDRMQPRRGIAFLQKPFSVSSLTTMVRQMLDTRAAHP